MWHFTPKCSLRLDLDLRVRDMCCKGANYILEEKQCSIGGGCVHVAVEDLRYVGSWFW